MSQREKLDLTVSKQPQDLSSDIIHSILLGGESSQVSKEPTVTPKPEPITRRNFLLVDHLKEFLTDSQKELKTPGDGTNLGDSPITKPSHWSRRKFFQNTVSSSLGVVFDVVDPRRQIRDFCLFLSTPGAQEALAIMGGKNRKKTVIEQNPPESFLQQINKLPENIAQTANNFYRWLFYPSKSELRTNLMIIPDLRVAVFLGLAVLGGYGAYLLVKHLAGEENTQRIREYTITGLSQQVLPEWIPGTIQDVKPKTLPPVNDSVRLVLEGLKIDNNRTISVWTLPNSTAEAWNGIVFLPFPGHEIDAQKLIMEVSGDQSSQEWIGDIRDTQALSIFTEQTYGGQTISIGLASQEMVIKYLERKAGESGAGRTSDGYLVWYDKDVSNLEGDPRPRHVTRNIVSKTIIAANTGLRKIANALVDNGVDVDGTSMQIIGSALLAPLEGGDIDMIVTFENEAQYLKAMKQIDVLVSNQNTGFNANLGKIAQEMFSKTGFRVTPKGNHVVFALIKDGVVKLIRSITLN